MGAPTADDLMFIASMAAVQLADPFGTDDRVSVRSEVRIAMSELLLAVVSEALGAALVALLIAAMRRLRGVAT